MNAKKIAKIGTTNCYILNEVAGKDFDYGSRMISIADNVALSASITTCATMKDNLEESI